MPQECLKQALLAAEGAGLDAINAHLAENDIDIQLTQEMITDPESAARREVAKQIYKVQRKAEMEVLELTQEVTTAVWEGVEQEIPKEDIDKFNENVSKIAMVAMTLNSVAGGRCGTVDFDFEAGTASWNPPTGGGANPELQTWLATATTAMNTSRANINRYVENEPQRQASRAVYDAEIEALREVEAVLI